MGYCRIGVDEWLRVPSVEDVFALGDCAGFLEQTGKPVLPALAQVRFSVLTCTNSSFFKSILPSLYAILHISLKQLPHLKYFHL